MINSIVEIVVTIIIIIAYRLYILRHCSLNTLTINNLSMTLFKCCPLLKFHICVFKYLVYNPNSPELVIAVNKALINELFKVVYVLKTSCCTCYVFAAYEHH